MSSSISIKTKMAKLQNKTSKTVLKPMDLTSMKQKQRKSFICSKISLNNLKNIADLHKTN